MRIAGGTAKRITKRIINFIFVIWGVVTLLSLIHISKDKDTDKKKKRRKVRRRNAVPPSANGVSIPVMKVWRVG